MGTARQFNFHPLLLGTITLLKKIFSIVDKSQLSNDQEYEATTQNFVQIGLGTHTYPLTRDINRINYSSHASWYEESFYGEQFTLPHLKLFSVTTNEPMKLSRLMISLTVNQLFRREIKIIELLIYRHLTCKTFFEKLAVNG